jgi:hypothetical protein
MQEASGVIRRPQAHVTVRTQGADRARARLRLVMQLRGAVAVLPIAHSEPAKRQPRQKQPHLMDTG